MQSTTWDNSETSLSPSDISGVTYERLERERRILSRVNLLGDELSYHDNSDQGIDGNESAREFLDTIEVFISTKTNEIAHARQRARQLSSTVSQSSLQSTTNKSM